MVMATAAISTAVSAPILWLLVIARSIQMFSVKEIDYRATGGKEKNS
jgi:hypothetical protein